MDNVRRHNQSHGRGHRETTFALDNPLWEDIGHGIISLKSNPNTRMRQSGGKWLPVSKESMSHLLAQQEASAEATTTTEAAPATT